LLSPLDSYLEVIRSAKNKTHFEDFKTGGRLSGDVRRGYQARMVAFTELANQGFVKIESGFLSLGSLSEVAWLEAGLLSGDPISWEICDLYPQKNRKFQPDQLHLQQIGRAGEDYVIELLNDLLEPEMRLEIVHTSLVDDTAGYDIVAPNPKNGGLSFLEVKTSTRPYDDFTFHLSRNEWATASKSNDWYLVLVQKVHGSCQLFGYLDASSLIDYYPKDSHTNFQWTSVRGKLGSDDVYVGLPGF
jgi:hypothetical protein